MKFEKKEAFVFCLLVAMFLAGYVSGHHFSGVELQKPDQELINLTIEMTTQETETDFSLIPVYIETGECIGFISDIDNSGKYMYLGLEGYPSIFQEG